jgi:hypothetical protein
MAAYRSAGITVKRNFDDGFLNLCKSLKTAR